MLLCKHEGKGGSGRMRTCWTIHLAKTRSVRDGKRCERERMCYKCYKCSVCHSPVHSIHKLASSWQNACFDVLEFASLCLGPDLLTGSHFLRLQREGEGESGLTRTQCCLTGTCKRRVVADGLRPSRSASDGLVDEGFLRGHLEWTVIAVSEQRQSCTHSPKEKRGKTSEEFDFGNNIGRGSPHRCRRLYSTLAAIRLQQATVERMRKKREIVERRIRIIRNCIRITILEVARLLMQISAG